MRCNREDIILIQHHLLTSHLHYHPVPRTAAQGMSNHASTSGDTKTSVDDAEVTVAQDTTTKTAKMQGRLGPWGRTVILSGWIIELIIFSFLFFLWYGEGSESGGQGASEIWRSIMLKGLASQSATLSSLVLRTVVDAQATVCTALVAALMLEARDVRISDIALFSVLRAVNGGPSSIAQPLAWSPRKFLRSWPAFLLLLLYISTVALQFSSTLLLTDFRQVSLLEFPQQSHVNILSTTSDLLRTPTNATASLAWETASTSYPSFAEQVVESPLELEGLSDTGSIKRAFLPFTSGDRQNLRRYQGAAVTYESRVACSRPSVEGFVQYSPTMGDYFPWIRGNITWRSEEAFGNFSCSQGETSCTRAFECALPYYANTTTLDSILSKQPTSLCLFNETDQTKPGLHTNFSDIFLVLSSDTNYEDWLNFDISGQTDDMGRYVGPSFSNEAAWSSDEWVGYEFGPVAKLNMTVCQNTIKMGFENITAAATVELDEPRLYYNATDRAWETGDVLDLMDVGNASGGTRGIMQISDTSAYTGDELDAMMKGSFDYDWLFSQNHVGGEIVVRQFHHFLLDYVKGGVLTSEGAKNYSVYFCTHCLIDGNLTDPHPSFSILFHAIVNQTGSVAPAMQSILFWMAQTQYYSSLSAFDYGGNATMVFSKTVSIPQKWNGITVVAAFVSLNMICVVMIAWLFLRRTSYSKYGDIWHTIAQIISPDLRHLLEKASKATDKQVTQSLKDAGSDKVDAGLYLLESGRVVALRNTAPFQHMAVDRMKTGLSSKGSKTSCTSIHQV